MIVSDLHTHTRFSDGKGQIAQNALAAKKAGLLQLGITDHGLRHIAYGIRQPDLARARREADRQSAILGIEVLFGVEANIYSSDGSIDIRGKNRDWLDFVVAGYHVFALPKSIADMCRYNLKGIFRRSISESDKKLFTKTFVNVIKSGKADIISHLCYALPVDVKQVGQASIDYGVPLELNGKKVSMTDEEVLLLAQMGVTFVVNSDAHRPERVGDFSVPMTLVDRLGINKNQIANWNKTVKFKR